MDDFISKVSSRGQVVIPLEVRKILNLKEGDYVVFIVDESNNINLKKGKIKIVLEENG